MFETLLAAIARALEERQIPYMVVGGRPFSCTENLG